MKTIYVALNIVIGLLVAAAAVCFFYKQTTYSVILVGAALLTGLVNIIFYEGAHKKELQEAGRWPVERKYYY